MQPLRSGISDIQFQVVAAGNAAAATSPPLETTLSLVSPDPGGKPLISMHITASEALLPSCCPRSVGVRSWEHTVAESIGEFQDKE